MKVFVTGGTGFIGSHLVDSLLAQNDTEVRCLIRSDQKWLKGKPIEAVSGDLHDLPALKKAMEGTDIVFHLAALVKARKMSTLRLVNVDATENLIRTAQRCGVKKIVILSSLAAVGPSFNEPIDENAPMMPVSMYGESKKEMEEMIRRVARPDDSITILRPPAVYGPREEQIYSFFKIASRGFCPIVGSPHKNHISMVHVADVVQGLHLAAQKTEKGVKTYFVSSEEAYPWSRIKDATAAALGRKLYTIPINPGIVKGLGAMLETAGSLIGVYPVMNKDKAREMTLQWTCSVDKIKEELGYRQRYSLEAGISDTINWYKKHNWI